MKVKNFIKMAMTTINTFVIKDRKGNIIITLFRADLDNFLPELERNIHSFTVESDKYGCPIYAIFVK